MRSCEINELNYGSCFFRRVATIKVYTTASLVLYAGIHFKKNTQLKKRSGLTFISMKTKTGIILAFDKYRSEKKIFASSN